jgi:hypothetical protein
VFNGSCELRWSTSPVSGSIFAEDEIENMFIRYCSQEFAAMKAQWVVKLDDFAVRKYR